MKQPISKRDTISLIRNGGDAETQFAALKLCSEDSWNDPVSLKIYHDTLLFLVAYPFNEKVYTLATDELKRLTKLLNTHQNNFRWQNSLSGSGLPFTELNCQFSADLLQWLLNKFPEQIIALESGAPGEIIQQFCQVSLPGIEFYHATQGNLNTWKRIKLLSGHYHNTGVLQWLLTLIRQQQWAPVLKDQLYDSLKIFVNWKLLDEKYTRSFLRCPVTAIHYRDPSEKKANSLSVIHKTLSKPKSLSATGKEELVAVARASLAFYYRETDPVSFADASDTQLFDMGGGLQIVLMCMNKERRLSLESYIGYMAFMNGVPVAYGGGWIFGHRCKIGINIYPPFRGRRSDMLFCQVLRLYYQYYNVKLFVVKPYQFGKGNPEGIRSGAFWFYYKLGFRPVNIDIRKKADEEWEKIIAERSYRTPASILKSFTACNKEWEPEKSSIDFFDADKVSRAVTKMICKRFSGNREQAVKASMKELYSFLGLKKQTGVKANEKKVWQNWGLLFSSLPQTGKWNKSQRKQFLKILKFKATGKESDFISELQQHKGFWVSVKEMLSNPG